MDIPLSIKEIQDGILKKKYSAVELVDFYLARIDKYNPKLNAFISVTKEESYKKAKEVDKLVSIHKDKVYKDFPLLGVTVAYKDLYLTKGVRSTASSKVLSDYVPEYSSTVFSKLNAAGTIFLGKTNCDAWAHGASGENSDFGPAKNPWDINRVPGGSSSGSAVAVSSGLSTIGMGTDTGGSVRQPANFCGVIGLKPTYGTVSRYGVIAMASSLDTMGHLTLCVEDSEKIFNTTTGIDYRDANLREEKASVTKKFRLGIPKEYFLKGIDKEVENTILDVINIYKKSGAEIVDISLPHTKYAISVYYIIQTAEVSSNLSRYDGVRFGTSRNNFGDEAKRRIMLGTYVLSAGYYDAYYLKAMKVRSKIINDFDQAFNKVDAIISPVSPYSAFKLGEKKDNPLEMYMADIFTASANLAGIPGLALPFEISKNGLPLGFQLLGSRFSENTLFSLGKIFEKETNYKPRVAMSK